MITSTESKVSIGWLDQCQHRWRRWIRHGRLKAKQSIIRKLSVSSLLTFCLISWHKLCKWQTYKMNYDLRSVYQANKVMKRTLLTGAYWQHWHDYIPTQFLRLQWLIPTLRKFEAHWPITTIRHSLTNVKDKDKPNNRQGTVYSIERSTLKLLPVKRLAETSTTD